MAKKIMAVLMLALSLSGCGKKEESKISRAHCYQTAGIEDGLIFNTEQTGYGHADMAPWTDATGLTWYVYPKKTVKQEECKYTADFVDISAKTFTSRLPIVPIMSLCLGRSD